MYLLNDSIIPFKLTEYFLLLKTCITSIFTETIYLLENVTAYREQQSAGLILSLTWFCGTVCNTQNTLLMQNYCVKVSISLQSQTVSLNDGRDTQSPTFAYKTLKRFFFVFKTYAVYCCIVDFFFRNFKNWLSTCEQQWWWGSPSPLQGRSYKLQTQWCGGSEILLHIQSDLQYKCTHYYRAYIILVKTRQPFSQKNIHSYRNRSNCVYFFSPDIFWFTLVILCVKGNNDEQWSKFTNDHNDLDES